MSHFRLRWRKAGGHIRAVLWVGTSRETTHGCSGELVFRESEWNDLHDLLPLLGDRVEVIHEEEEHDQG